MERWGDGGMKLKFRAWDKRKNEMYNPDELTIQINGSEILVALESSLHQIFNCELMQSTGLKDKNGVQIFEGDIVNNAYGDLCLVEWGTGGYVLNSISSGDPYYINYQYIYPANIEVKGNKFENPELMEEMVE